VAEAIQERGFVTRGPLGVGTVRGSVRRTLPSPEELGDRRFDYILLATRPPEVEAAAESVLPLLAEEGLLVCLQNGLCEARVAERLGAGGADKVAGAVVGWGASMHEPGVYERTSAGGFTLGLLEGDPESPQMRRLATLLELVGPVSVSDNLSGARWSKLAINCAISSLGTIGGDRLGALMRHRFVRRLFLEVISETVAVAAAEGVRLEKVSGTLDLPWLALTEEERGAQVGSATLMAKHALLLAVGARFRKLRSSMLRAIEGGRDPGVGFLNGEVTRRGERHRLPTPINAAVVDQVRRIAEGRDRSSVATLRSLFERTRGL
jgi:2-dehydropantoate 2-reductase